MSMFSLMLVGLLAGAAPEAPAPAPDTLVLQRTACSGNCPVYTLTLQRNGRVHFVGVKDVALIGETDWKIEPIFAQHLFGEFERSGFAALGPKFPTEVEEFPGVVLTLTLAGHSQRAQLGGEGTEDLPRDLLAEKLIKRLAVTIDKLTASAKVVETDSKKKAGGCID